MNDLVHALMQVRNKTRPMSHQVPSYPAPSPIQPGPFQMNPDLKGKLEQGIQDRNDEEFKKQMDRLLRDKYGAEYEKAERCVQLFGYDLDAIDKCMQQDEISI